MKKTYNIEVDCANCANNMEKELKKVTGIKNVSVNFMMQKIEVEFEENVNQNEVMQNAYKHIKDVDDEIEIYF